MVCIFARRGSTRNRRLPRRGGGTRRACRPNLAAAMPCAWLRTIFR